MHGRGWWIWAASGVLGIEPPMAKTLLQWIELNRTSFHQNVRQFRQLIGPGRKLLAMVKANGYGHGMKEISGLALAAGADWLGVHSLEEGIVLQELGITAPVLISGYIAASDLREAVDRDLRLTVYNPETVAHLAQICRRLGKKAYLHIKLETGTHRQGLDPARLVEFCEQLPGSGELVVEGISSHFADIEDTTDHSYAQRQIQIFNQALARLNERHIQVPIRHMSCTAAGILFPETHFDMLRVGIGLYGLWPSKETYVSCIQRKRDPLRLEPVLSWKARIAQLKRIGKGEFIGYGRTYRTTRPTCLAVIPIGYFDGYPRVLSNLSHVLVKGQRAPLRGRVAMNFITVDVTDIPDVGIEEEVILIGRVRDDEVSADMLAAWAGTINYEIVARLHPAIPRIVSS
jgi:alanine racemase